MKYEYKHWWQADGGKSKYSEKPDPVSLYPRTVSKLRNIIRIGFLRFVDRAS